MSQPAQSQTAQPPPAGTDDETGTKPFSWRFTTPLFIGSALNPVNSSLIATALVPIAAGVHVSIGQTAALVTALYLASAIAQPTAGKVAEVFGPRRVFLAGILLVLIGGVVLTAVAGPLVGYEIGRRMGDRLFTSQKLRRVAGPLDRARVMLRDRGGLAVLGGRFVAVVRALMPTAAGAAAMPYRVFAIHNLVGGVIWGVGYSLLGYLAGSAYGVVERAVGAGLAIAVAVVVVAAAGAWAWRRHARLASTRAGDAESAGPAAAVPPPAPAD